MIKIIWDKCLVHNVGSLLLIKVLTKNLQYAMMIWNIIRIYTGLEKALLKQRI